MTAWVGALVGRVRFTELQLLVVPSVMTVVGLLTIFLASTRDLNWDWRDIWVSLAFMVAVFGISLWLSANQFRGDQVIFPIVVALAGLGLLMIQRLAPDLTEADHAFRNLARNQLIYLAIGLSLLLCVCTFVRQIGWLRRYKYTWALLGLAMMAVTMVIGTELNGAKLWIEVGPFSIQPSEPAKVAMVVFLAAYLAENRELIVSNYRVGPFNLPPIPYLMPMVLMWAFSLLIVVLQNDLGTAMLFFGVFLAMLYLASGRLLYVVTGLACFGIGVYAALQLFPRITVRVSNWLDPWQDPLDAGYQGVQSEYALATGQFFGTGLAQGNPTFIPEVHSDYVFSAIGEELGLLGAVVVLLLFLLLAFRGFFISLRARDTFGQFLAVGLTTVFALQSLIIVAGVVRLIPLTGITLPFISAGGSSLITNFLMVGLLMRISDPDLAR
ncbi:MAG TPA: FtsW/RodA/SpoVE family cell cycle protein [Thermomicrobiales bacterium]|nr:FtsW/RodA/SpoVE family cell cycle protein [Thermomicrobiales bacterium]